MSKSRVHNAPFGSCHKRSTVSTSVPCITKHRSRFRHEFRLRLISRSREERARLGRGGAAAIRTQDSPVSHSAIDPLRRRLFAVPPPRRPALAIPYYISPPTPQPQTHLTSTNKPPTPPTNNHPEEPQLRTASASSPLRAYSLTSLSPTDAGPGRRNHVESQDQRHHTKRPLIRHPGARCRYRASRHSLLREIAALPDFETTTGEPKRKELQHRTSAPTHISYNGGNKELRFSCT